MENAYCRFPHVHEAKIVFVARDQIWLSSLRGGMARALTEGPAQKGHPFFSPDGQSVAFTSAASGRTEVHVVSTAGGAPERQLSYFGANLRTIGWRGEQVLVTGNRGRPFGNFYGISAVDRAGEAEELPVGPAVFWAEHPAHGRVLSRYELLEASSWKRYRGGCRGDLWIDRQGDGRFEPFLTLEGNLSRPHWVGDRLYFLSDHEGCGNLYSCSATGGELAAHSKTRDFYLRHLSGDGSRLVYSLGGDLFHFDPAKNGSARIDVSLPPLGAGWSRRRETAEASLQELAVSPSSVAIVSRGQLLAASAGDPEFRQRTAPGASPLRLARWHGEALLAFREREGIEFAVTFEGGAERETECSAVGRVITFEPRPQSRGEVALTNQRLELLLLDTSSGKFTVIDRSAVEPIGELAWSADGRFLAYSFALSPFGSVLRIHDVAAGRSYPATDAFLRDRSPCFDPAGGFLYFLSERSLQPVPGELGAPCAFGPAWQPCRVPLGALAEMPARLEVLPLPPGEYPSLWAARDSVLYVDKRRDGAGPQATLYRWDAHSREENRLLDDISMVQVSTDGTAIAFLREGRIERLGEGAPALSLKDAVVSYDARVEWASLFELAWSLQRDYFWDAASTGGAEWRAKRELYRPLVGRLASRGECSDLLWQLNGELATSHSYEFRRDEDAEGKAAPGFLAAELERAPGGYRLKKALPGVAWDVNARSPLLGLPAGSLIESVDGRRLEGEFTLARSLAGKAGQEISLGIAGEATPRKVRALASETTVRYSEWQRSNRDTARRLSGGSVGYLHLPNTQPPGYAEFHRQFLAEHRRESLILDLRYNSGGNLGEFVLDRLARRRLGGTRTRGLREESFPPLAGPGRLAVLINGFCGSDGEMLAECLRTLGLARLFGTPTWGGVTGAKGRTDIVGGGALSQPRTVFQIEGAPRIENRGVLPDVPVEISPGDYACGADPQLAAAVASLISS